APRGRSAAVSRTRAAPSALAPGEAEALTRERGRWADAAPRLEADPGGTTRRLLSAQAQSWDAAHAGCAEAGTGRKPHRQAGLELPAPPAPPGASPPQTPPRRPPGIRLRRRLLALPWSPSGASGVPWTRAAGSQRDTPARSLRA